MAYWGERHLCGYSRTKSNFMIITQGITVNFWNFSVSVYILINCLAVCNINVWRSLFSAASELKEVHIRLCEKRNATSCWYWLTSLCHHALVISAPDVKGPSCWPKATKVECQEAFHDALEKHWLSPEPCPALLAVKTISICWLFSNVRNNVINKLN